MKPSELKILTEKSKHKEIENNKALKEEAARESKHYVESWYTFNLRIIPAILTEAARSGKNEASVFDWTTNGHRVAENTKIAAMLEAALKEEGHSVDYLDYDQQGSAYDSPVEHCRSLMVTW